MNKSNLTSLGRLMIIVVIIIAIGGGVFLLKKNNIISNSNNSADYSEAIVLNGLVGSEKANLFDNEEIKAILRNKYNITIKYSKVGSLEMIANETSASNYDFYFLSSQTALEILRSKVPEKIKKSELIFNSPLVFYSWNIIVDKLIKKNLVKKVDNTYFMNDVQQLVDLIENGKKWEDLGITELYGKINILSTDPNKSSSGAMFAGLLANILAKDELTSNNIQTFLPKLKVIYSNLGFLESSTGNLFEQYLKIGVGGYPIIVGYENQMIEFSDKYKDIWASVKQKAVVIYPEPTLWTSHPLVAANDQAVRLIDAMKDPAIQEIAWKQHGFRSGVIGIKNDVNSINIQGVPTTVTKVVQVPSGEIMLQILNELKVQ